MIMPFSTVWRNLSQKSFLRAISKIKPADVK